MAGGPGLHTRIVAILKVGFPILAAGLFLSVFVFRPEDDEAGAIVFSEADLDQLGKGLQITNPTFTGSSREGDAFRFVADLVEPDAAPPTRASISNLSGEIDFTGGMELAIRAETGELTIADHMLDLAGSVRAETGDGYVLTAEQISIDLARGVLKGRGDVETTGPVGHIRSETLEVAPSRAGATDRRFSFGNGVRLIYDPPQDPHGIADETPDPPR